MFRRALALGLLLCCAGVAPGQGSPGQDSIDQARARWESMDPQQRAELKRRFEQLRALDSDGRRDLERRHRELREREAEAVDELPQPVRERLETLPPDQRRTMVRELTREALERRGRSIREELPEPLRERLERADPRERRALLAELKGARKDERMQRALGKLERDLELPEGERRGPDQLRPEEREARLFELHRRRVERRVEGEGLPEWIGPDEWKRWGELPPREFHERMDRSRRERGGGSFREAFKSRRGPDPSAPDPSAPEPSAPESGAPEPGTPDRDEPAEIPRRPSLGQLMHPDPVWRLELLELSPQARRAEISRRVKERVLEAGRTRPDLFEAGELERLEQLDGEAFEAALRERREARRSGGEAPWGPRGTRDPERSREPGGQRDPRDPGASRRFERSRPPAESPRRDR